VAGFPGAGWRRDWRDTGKLGRQQFAMIVLGALRIQEALIKKLQS
jgi:hypothetical protein